MLNLLTEIEERSILGGGGRIGALFFELVFTTEFL
jgi:hypothetical protein